MALMRSHNRQGAYHMGGYKRVRRSMIMIM
ncbi:uncharacterized protein G2W53_010077 [Senna tora]|uniref:Uncharacterized protein n=1 Tax=Senna tora TaxID=362788 RepID=A0A834WZG6_9FABA|nr:uncharacterized protein G2W53_010077 [Senna tora]